MPIVSLDLQNAKLHTVCAVCNAAHQPDVAALVVGHPVTELPVILLPACDCGAQENLIATTDRAPKEAAGSYQLAHRWLVNALAQHLLAAGQVASERFPDGVNTPDLPPGPGPYELPFPRSLAPDS